MQEVVQPWEPHFVHQEIVQETVRCLTNQKSTKRKHEEVGPMRRILRVLSRGAQPDAMSGGIRAAATTQPADEEGQEPVDG